MKTFRLIVPLMALLLSGCSSVSDLLDVGKTDYKSASRQSLPPLEIPPNLTRPTGDDRFSLPATAATGSSTTYSAYAAGQGAAPKPGSTDLLPSVAKVRMERAGTQRWLVVPETPEKIWPIVKEFWQESGFLVNLEIPEAGVMETDWAENRAKIPSDMIRSTLGRVLDQVYSTGERDKFRTRLERGSEPNTTEIYISHRGVEEVVTAMSSSSNSPASFVWQPKRPDPDLEAEFLRKLMVRFGVEDNRAREMVAVAPKIERAKYVKAAEGGAGLLELDEPFDRAWRRVGLALDRVGFTVEDRDRSKGFYFVRYLDPESDAATKKNDGVLSKLAFWRSDKPAAKSEQYRVLVKESKDTSQVQVLNKEGAPDRSDVAQKILSLLHEQLK
jgi:outer membrane protein assembly factor BamC